MADKRNSLRANKVIIMEHEKRRVQTDGTQTVSLEGTDKTSYDRIRVSRLINLHLSFN